MPIYNEIYAANIPDHAVCSFYQKSCNSRTGFIYTFFSSEKKLSDILLIKNFHNKIKYNIQEIHLKEKIINCHEYL